MTRCTHPTRGSYNQGCRCWGCTKANSDYEYKRSHGLTEQQFLDEGYTSHIKTHVKKALELVSKREFCRLADVNRSVLDNLLTAHHRTGKPIRRIKADTGRRLLRVAKQVRRDASMRAPLDKTLVDSGQWVQEVDKWVRLGVSVRQIARITGIGACTLYTRYERKLVTQLSVERLERSREELARAVYEKGRKYA